jgi:hypothetical protein
MDWGIGITLCGVGLPIGNSRVTLGPRKGGAIDNNCDLRNDRMGRLAYALLR